MINLRCHIVIIISFDLIIYNYTAKTNVIFTKAVEIEKNIQISAIIPANQISEGKDVVNYTHKINTIKNIFVKYIHFQMNLWYTIHI